MPLVRALVVWRLTGDMAGSVEGDLKLDYLYRPFHTHADGLIMGLLLAHLQVFDGDRFKRGFPGSIFPVLISAGVFIVCFHSILVSFSGCALLFGSCTWFLVARRRPWLGVLESRARSMSFRVSPFGMYLNHFYLLEPAASFTFRYLPGAGWAPALQQILGTIFIAIASAALAALTFCLIEWPFLRLREWILSRGRRPILACKPAPAAVTVNRLSDGSVLRVRLLHP